MDLSEIVSKLLIGNSAAIIVDVGCGPGLLVRELMSSSTCRMVVGVDPSICMLKTGARIVGCGFLVRSMGEFLPFRDSIVDLVVSRFSLPYWSNPNGVFQEIYRVLKPRGFLVVDALNASYSRLKLFLTKIFMFIRGAPRSVVEYHIDAYSKAYTMEELCDIIMGSDFNIIRVDDYSWFFRVIAEKK